jgi:transcriptional regulator
MYVHPAFKTTDDDAWAFAAHRGFGTLIATPGGMPTAVHVPFLLEKTPTGGRVELHVARANPIHQALAAAPDVLVVVAGPDAYISPDWYVSAEQVPTWNYVAVHLTGLARLMPPDESHGHVERLSAAFEARIAPKKPWAMAKVSAERQQMMLKAIVPIEIQVTGIEATRKLGQNKSAADRAAVTKMLSWQGDWSALAVAELMRSDNREPAAGPAGAIAR